MVAREIRDSKGVCPGGKGNRKNYEINIEMDPKKHVWEELEKYTKEAVE